jgi:hypothetical protein
VVGLEFILDGPHGSKLQIDDISMPGVQNGGFDYGLDGWDVGGEGTATVLPVPEPSSLVLLACGALFMPRRRR